MITYLIYRKTSIITMVLEVIIRRKFYIAINLTRNRIIQYLQIRLLTEDKDISGFKFFYLKKILKPNLKLIFNAYE